MMSDPAKRLTDSVGVVLDKRSFLASDQLRFAELSGDFNPIHMDPVAARRTLAGEVVVHGVHGVVWALDRLAHLVGRKTAAIEVKFLKPIHVGEPVECLWDEHRSRIALMTGDVRLVEIRLAQGNVEPCSQSAAPPAPRSLQPAVLTMAQLVDYREYPFFFRGNRSFAQRMFPAFCAAYGEGLLCDFAALSELVGMQAPGLNSLIGNLSIKILADPEIVAPQYRIENYDTRFRMMALKVQTFSLVANLIVFVRPESTELPTMNVISKRLDGKEFAGVRALIVGGSRGLGAATAKIIACGGGEAIVSYNVGAQDAETLCEEIRRYGGKAFAIKLDITSTASEFPECGAVNHLYYFATPKIFGKRSLSFDQALYEQFCDFYAGGFQKALKLARRAPGTIAAFYPSTIAIDEPIAELEEYIAAKRVGENMCEALAQESGLVILKRRLPRTATDQTLSLLTIASDDPVDVLLPIIRDMQIAVGGIEA